MNDSKATNVEATAVALQGLGGRKAVVLLGGVAKVSQGVVCSWRVGLHGVHHSLLTAVQAGSDGKRLGFERLLTLLNAHRTVITVRGAQTQTLFSVTSRVGYLIFCLPEME